MQLSGLIVPLILILVEINPIKDNPVYLCLLLGQYLGDRFWPISTLRKVWHIADIQARVVKSMVGFRAGSRTRTIGQKQTFATPTENYPAFVARFGYVDVW